MFDYIAKTLLIELDNSFNLCLFVSIATKVIGGQTRSRHFKLFPAINLWNNKPLNLNSDHFIKEPSNVNFTFNSTDA